MSELESDTRLKALQASGLLSKNVQDRICHLAFTAARLTDADIAQVNVLDSHLQYHVCQWPGQPSDTPLPANLSGCRAVVLSDATVMIPNTQDHPVTCDMPWAGTYSAYLGTPIRFRNEVIGALCVLAGDPRAWSKQDVMAIEGVAHLLMLSLD